MLATKITKNTKVEEWRLGLRRARKTSVPDFVIFVISVAQLSVSSVAKEQ